MILGLFIYLQNNNNKWGIFLSLLTIHYLYLTSCYRFYVLSKIEQPKEKEKFFFYRTLIQKRVRNDNVFV